MKASPTIDAAIALHRSGRFDEARAAYRALLEVDGDDADALHYLGLLQHQSGESEQGVDLMVRSLERSPDNVHALNNLGNVYRQCGRNAEAEACYRRALELEPGNAGLLGNLAVVLNAKGRLRDAYTSGLEAVKRDPEAAGHWVNLGNTLLAAGQHDPAMQAYRAAIERDAGLIGAYVGLSRALHAIECQGGPQQNLRDELAAVYRQWLQGEPDSPFARHMLAACEGRNDVPRAPDEYVRATFDEFAESFDEKLARLDYRVPGLVKAWLDEQLAADQTDLVILDAGCGTGLCGPFLASSAARLVGVDLSAGMLERARRREAYDELHEAELSAWLGGRDAEFHLVVCADTLCYFGQLDGIVALLAGTLTPGGRLLFTVEHSEEGARGWRLNSSGRFAHGKDHVRGVLAGAGLDLVVLQPEILRHEGGRPVQGLLVVARKAGAE